MVYVNISHCAMFQPLSAPAFSMTHRYRTIYRGGRNRGPYSIFQLIPRELAGRVQVEYVRISNSALNFSSKKKINKYILVVTNLFTFHNMFLYFVFNTKKFLDGEMYHWRYNMNLLQDFKTLKCGINICKMLQHLKFVKFFDEMYSQKRTIFKIISLFEITSI